MQTKAFITATDTDAGKTWVTSAAIRGLLAQGVTAKALKPVACGLNAQGRNDDVDALLLAQHITESRAINRYCFHLPAAPSQAAATQQQCVDPDILLQWCHTQAHEMEHCLIEGVGGVMTPITSTWLVSDWIKAMPDYAVWLVVACKLGAINQTLLSLHLLQSIGCAPSRIFFNATTSAQNDWIIPTRQAILPFLPSTCIAQNLRFHETYLPIKDLCR